eukprot:CFRG6180T1
MSAVFDFAYGPMSELEGLTPELMRQSSCDSTPSTSLEATSDPWGEPDWMGTQFGVLKSMANPASVNKSSPAMIDLEYQSVTQDHMDQFEIGQDKYNQENLLLENEFTSVSASSEDFLFAAMPSNVQSLGGIIDDNYDTGMLFKSEITDCDSGLSLPPTPNDNATTSSSDLHRLSSVVSAHSLDSFTSDFFSSDEILNQGQTHHQQSQGRFTFDLGNSNTSDSVCQQQQQFGYNDLSRSSISSRSSDGSFMSNLFNERTSNVSQEEMFTFAQQAQVVPSQNMTSTTVQQFQQQQQKQQHGQSQQQQQQQQQQRGSSVNKQQQYLNHNELAGVGMRNAHMFRAMDDYATTGSMANIQSINNSLNTTKIQQFIPSATTTIRLLVSDINPAKRVRSIDSISSTTSSTSSKKTKRPKTSPKTLGSHPSKTTVKNIESAMVCGVDGTKLPTALIDDASKKTSALKSNNGGQKSDSNGPVTCANCETQTTTMWRNNSAGQVVCNACGLYERVNNCTRPKYLKSTTIRRRKPRRCKALEQGVRPCVVQIRPNLNAIGPMPMSGVQQNYSPQVNPQQQQLLAAKQREPQVIGKTSNTAMVAISTKPVPMLKRKSSTMGSASFSPSTSKSGTTTATAPSQNTSTSVSGSTSSATPAPSISTDDNNSTANSSTKLGSSQSPTSSIISSVSAVNVASVPATTETNTTASGGVAFNSDMQKLIMNRCKNIPRAVDSSSTSRVLASVVKAEMV